MLLPNLTLFYIILAQYNFKFQTVNFDLKTFFVENFEQLGHFRVHYWSNNSSIL